MGGVTYLEGIYLSQQLKKAIGIPFDSKLILSVGELNKNKNHEVVIRALAEINDMSVHYAIAGTGELHNYLENLANELGISESVHLLGYRTDIAALYKAADICMFPSIREGLGLAAIEGMASGLPLICADNRGSRDYAVNGENAIVCKYDDVSQFARALTSMFTDTNLKIRMENLNKKKAQKYDVNVVIKQMKKIYGEIL